jgi:competence protein ComEC
MFGLMAFAGLINRKSNIYNTIALSAFIILMINPSMLFDLGFQLSYSAVLGIVYFYPKLYELVKINNIVLEKLHSLSCVSIAATVSTVPITLYYFHQFSNVFLLSNFIVIPLASGILISGILLFVFGQIYFLSSILGLILQFLINSMYHGIAFLQRLPRAFISDIYFDKLDLIILISIVILIILIIEFRKRAYLYLLCILMCAFFGSNIYREIQTERQHGFSIFSDGTNDFFIEINAKSAKFFDFGKHPSNGDPLDGLSNFKRELRITHLERSEPTLIDSARVWKMNGTIFFQPFDTLYFMPKIDWLYINNENCKINLFRSYKPLKGFLLGNNIPFFSRQKILRELKIMNLNFHDLSIHKSMDLMLYGIN